MEYLLSLNSCLQQCLNNLFSNRIIFLPFLLHPFYIIEKILNFSLPKFLLSFLLILIRWKIYILLMFAFLFSVLMLCFHPFFNFISWLTNLKMCWEFFTIILNFIYLVPQELGLDFCLFCFNPFLVFSFDSLFFIYFIFYDVIFYSLHNNNFIKLPLWLWWFIRIML